MKTESSLNQKQGHWILAKLGKKYCDPEVACLPNGWYAI